MEHSELYDMITRNNKNLFQPQSYRPVYRRGPYNDGIKVHNNLPTQTKLLSRNFNQFKKALKYFLHSFYTSA